MYLRLFLVALNIGLVLSLTCETEDKFDELAGTADFLRAVFSGLSDENATTDIPFAPKEMLKFASTLSDHDMKGLFYLNELSGMLNVSCGSFALPFSAYWNLLSYNFPDLHKNGIAAFKAVQKRVEGLPEAAKKPVKKLFNNILENVMGAGKENAVIFGDFATAVKKMTSTERAKIDVIFPLVTTVLESDEDFKQWTAKFDNLEQYRNQF